MNPEILPISFALAEKITNYILSVRSAEKPNREAFEIILELNKIVEQEKNKN